MSAFEAQFVDVRAEGLGVPQPVDREQRHQGVFVLRAESGGDRQRSDLVAVQSDGVGLVVQAWASHMHRG